MAIKHSFPFDIAVVVITIMEEDWSTHDYWYSYRCGYRQGNRYTFPFNTIVTMSLPTIIKENLGPHLATGKAIGTLHTILLPTYLHSWRKTGSKHGCQFAYR